MTSLCNTPHLHGFLLSAIGSGGGVKNGLGGKPNSGTTMWQDIMGGLEPRATYITDVVSELL